MNLNKQSFNYISGLAPSSSHLILLPCRASQPRPCHPGLCRTFRGWGHPRPDKTSPRSLLVGWLKGILKQGRANGFKVTSDYLMLYIIIINIICERWNRM